MAARRLSFLVLAIVQYTARAAGHGVTPDGTLFLQQAVSTQDAHLVVYTPAQLSSCSKMDYGDNRFNIEYGLMGRASQTFTLETACGNAIDLSGWSQTKFCYEGFARNTEGDATAVVRGLKAGSSYDFKIWQIAYLFPGDSPLTNPLAINGVSFGRTTTTQMYNPSAMGATTADSTGRITFTFTRESSAVTL
uniref:Uncharacterized protein n=1 Tax=Alexandrium monilatum TaxID=311494 RepID=A0A6T1HI53_9DINO